MTDTKSELVLVPIEILRVIPLYNGDKSQLKLFLRKCEYVIDMYKGNDAQNLYLFHTITSRLVDKAASLLSEKEGVDTWKQLKELLIENYSDSRSEESIAVDFQSLKINHNENFLSFYNRLHALHKTLISKIDIIDEPAKCKKIALYNNMAITVLLYNLPEFLVQIIRLKAPDTLEEAYKIVTEEISFFKKYAKHQATGLNTVPDFKCFYYTNSFKPFFPQPSNSNKLGFGSAQTNQFQSISNQQSTCFGSVPSHQVQSTQNQMGASNLFGSTQSNPRIASVFGAPKQIGYKTQFPTGQNDNNLVKIDNVKPSSLHFNVQHDNEEE